MYRLYYSETFNVCYFRSAGRLSNRSGAGVGIGIDVEPGVQRRENADGQHDNNGEKLPSHGAKVVYEDVKNLPHNSLLGCHNTYFTIFFSPVNPYSMGADRLYICAEYDIVDPKKFIVRQRYDMERIQLQDNKRDLAVLVGLRSPVLREDSTDEESLEELSALVETAGGQVVGSILQSRDKPDPHSFIGEG